MLKALAIELLWSPFSTKAKRHHVHVIKKTEKNQVKFRFAVLLIVLNVLLLGGYVYGVNQYASSGYEIKQLQTKLTALNAENKKLSIKVAEAGSMVSIQTDFLSSNFVPAGTSAFLQVNQFSQK